MFDSSILLLLIGLPLFGILVLFFIPDTKPDLQKNIGLITSLLTFLLSLKLWLQFDLSTPKYQFIDKFFSVPYSNMHVYVGVDGISLFFLLFFCLCILYLPARSVCIHCRFVPVDVARLLA